MSAGSAQKAGGAMVAAPHGRSSSAGYSLTVHSLTVHTLCVQPDGAQCEVCRHSSLRKKSACSQHSCSSPELGHGLRLSVT